MPTQPSGEHMNTQTNVTVIKQSSRQQAREAVKTLAARYGKENVKLIDKGGLYSGIHRWGVEITTVVKQRETLCIKRKLKGGVFTGLEKETCQKASTARNWMQKQTGVIPVYYKPTYRRKMIGC